MISDTRYLEGCEQEAIWGVITEVDSMKCNCSSLFSRSLSLSLSLPQGTAIWPCHRNSRIDQCAATVLVQWDLTFLSFVLPCQTFDVFLNNIRHRRRAPAHGKLHFDPSRSVSFARLPLVFSTIQLKRAFNEVLRCPLNEKFALQSKNNNIQNPF